MKKINLQKGIAMPLVIGIIVLVLIVIGAVYFLLNKQASVEDSMEKEIMEKEVMEENGDSMMEEGNNKVMEDGSMIKGDSMMDDKTMIKYSGSVIAGKSSPLLDFNKADYDMALKTDKLIVLYFYANWCPICKAEVNSALYPAFNEIIGEKVVGFRVNYNDNQTNKDEENLAREFGVAYQHTKVFLKNGERILKSPESWNKDRYHQEINDHLN